MTKKKPLTKVVAENLRALMAAPQYAHLDSTRKLERASGVSHKTISNYLAERHDVQLSNLEKIAKAFRIEPLALLSTRLDQSLIDICHVYFDADQRGRDLLADTAVTVRRRIGASAGDIGGPAKPSTAQQ